MEEGEVGEEAELLREVPGDVGVVEVNAGDDSDGRAGRGRGAEDAGVGADVGAGPGGGEVEGVREDGGFPCLQGNVGLAEPGVFEMELAYIVGGGDLGEREEREEEEEESGREEVGSATPCRHY